MRPALLAGIVFLSITIFSCASPEPAHQTRIAADTATRNQKVAALRSIPPDVFDEFVFESKNGRLPYRMLQPPSSLVKKYPLVVVFHGSGAVGTDNRSQVGILAKYFADSLNRRAFPAFVIAPQFPSRSSNYVMDKILGVLKSEMQPCGEMALELINHYRRDPRIDTNRIYVIGFSMGASTVINVISRHPEWFAAAVSISGIPQFDQLKRLEKFPLLLVHGTADNENPIDSDRLFFEEMQKQKHNKTRLIEYRDLGHNDMQMEIVTKRQWAEWLFANHK
ncbi:prolyl oligopeptidase family serine peptidase [Nostoc ellipsosporum NOK]|nr:prolyl oligopeptidase family serine peptidase [Nostoc ellipsosporum NOK]